MLKHAYVRGLEDALTKFAIDATTLYRLKELGMRVLPGAAMGAVTGGEDHRLLGAALGGVGGGLGGTLAANAAREPMLRASLRPLGNGMSTLDINKFTALRNAANISGGALGGAAAGALGDELS